MAFTLAEMQEKVRERADMQNSTFISDVELTGYINASYAELYDLLVGRFEDYFSKQQDIQVGGAATGFPLPTDCYKVRGLDFMLDPSNAYTVRKFNFEERNRIDRARTRLLNGYYDRTYRVMGQTLMILPSDKAPGAYKLWYIPRFTPLVADADQMGDVLDFEEYVVVDAAMKCLVKEESDISSLFTIKQGLKERIEAMASNRDTTPDRISDVRMDNADDIYPFAWR